MRLKGKFWAGVIAILTLLVANGPCSAAHAATLLHKYTFQNGVTDSVGTLNGTLVGTATVSGGALNIGGSGYADLGAMAIPTGAFSVILSAKGTMDGQYAEMISQGATTLPGFYIGYQGTGTMRLGDQFTSTNIVFPTDNLWHTYALTSGSTGTSFYIDQKLAFTSATQIIVPTTGSTTRLGNQFAPYAEYFPGQITNVQIYSGVVNVLPESPQILLLVGLFALLARAGSSPFQQKQRSRLL